VPPEHHVDLWFLQDGHHLPAVPEVVALAPHDAAVAEESSPLSNHPPGGAQHVLSVCAPGERSGAERPGFRAQGGLFYLDGVA
jgi:hypothetical protein